MRSGVTKKDAKFSDDGKMLMAGFITDKRLECPLRLRSVHRTQSIWDDQARDDCSTLGVERSTIKRSCIEFMPDGRED